MNNIILFNKHLFFTSTQQLIRKIKIHDNHYRLFSSSSKVYSTDIAAP
ncbi:unnamed protein product, partial [Adineta steineri]